MLVLGVLWTSLLWNIVRTVLLLSAVLLWTRGILLLLLLGWGSLTEQLLMRLFSWWVLFRNLHDDIGWLADNFSLETFFWISGVSDGTAEAT